ncbi:MAG: sugar ABC transporter permease [Caldilineaceae bacterium]|nr:sugar ABC transporter permease [Caldilineaceae bacterium]
MGVATNRKFWAPRQQRELLKGLLFVSPWLLGFAGFTVYPILASLYYSLTQYDILRPPRFIGLANYHQLFFQDEVFRFVLYNTLYLVVIGVPAGVVTAFMVASLLNNEMKLRPLFRTLFFVPALVPAVAAAEVWRWVYNTNFGVVNSLLKWGGMSIIPFLSSPDLAKPSLILIHMWAQGTAIVIFLAALQDVPRSLYDAALVDGANLWHRFWNVTIPMCTPTILFVALTSMINMFQYFTIGWLLTEGGPNQSTEFYGIYLYRNAFLFFKMGYASALSWILFLIIVAFTILIFRASQRRVYYAGDGES